MTELRQRQRRKRLQILAAAAGVLTVLAVLVNLDFRGGPVQTGRTGQPVLPDFAETRAEAAEIRVTLADESYRLLNSVDGWTLEGTHGYPVRADRLADLATGLGELVWGEARTRDPGKLNRIGLGDPREGRHRRADRTGEWRRRRHRRDHHRTEGRASLRPPPG